jgi:hypothetical protein
MKSAEGMTVEEILDRDTYVTASRPKKGPDGIYVKEAYRGRGVRVEKTGATYVIRLSNPRAEFLTKDVVGAVEMIKRELGSLSG